MSTPSLICMELPSGEVQNIYCHFDGYPSHNGRILKEHYKDKEIVEALMGLGNLSHLGPVIGGKVNFEQFVGKEGTDDQCVAYGRDRGETGQEARTVPFDKLAKEAHDCNAEFIYLYRDGNWLVAQPDNMEFVEIEE